MEKGLYEKLQEVGLQMQPYWSSRYLKSVDKLSKPLFKTQEEKDVYVAVSDGTKLCTDIFRPDVEGKKFPALIAWSSYGKSEQSVQRDPLPAGALLLDHSVEVPDLDFFISRGYVFVIPDPRGVGKSEGEWNGMFSPQEQKDLRDVIEWVASQPWCDGNVGMAGVSYFGHIQPLAASEQPPHLKAIMPWTVFYDFYDWISPGGMLYDFFHCFLINNSPNNPVSESERTYSAEELRSKIQAALQDPFVKSNTYYVKILNNWPPRYNTWFLDILLHPFDAPIWHSRSPRNKADKIKIPTYLLGSHKVLDGFTDPNLDVPKKAFVVGVYPFPSAHPCPYRYTQEEMLRWYDYWFKGIDTGLMDEPPIKLYITGVGRYRYENEWPLARTVWTKFYFQQFKKLGAEIPHYYNAGPDAFTHVPSELRTLDFDVPSLTFSTDPLSQSLEICGPVGLYLYASIDAEDANFIVELQDISAAGKTVVAYGGLRASHRALDKERSKPWKPIHDHTRAVPVTPGEINEYAIDLNISHVFLPGHRMALQIKAASPAVPRYTGSTTIGYVPAPWVTTYRIYHDENHPSHLVLPVVRETPKDLWLD
jgi:predicted acyl esterase